MVQNSLKDPNVALDFSNGKNFEVFRRLIWELADPNKDSYNPMRALLMLRSAITDKWMVVQQANEERGIERSSYQEFEDLQHAPIIDNGDKGVERQVRTAVNTGLRYLGTSTTGWQIESLHELARKNLGFYHPSSEDTSEQHAAFYRENLRIVHETELLSSIYNLGEAVDAQHLAYLQSSVDFHREFLSKLADMPVPEKPPVCNWRPSVAPS